MKSSGNIQIIITVPSVEEGLYYLRADGIACQIWDAIEMIPPESGQGF